MMSCEETRQTLSLYVDDCISLPARVAIDEHLDRCPVCRAEIAELRSLTRGLSLMTRPKPPATLADTISDLLVIEAAARRQAPPPSLGRRIARFLEPRLMPYSVGSFASVILFTLMLSALRPHFIALREAALQNNVVVLQTTEPSYDLYSPEDLARRRAPFGEQSPSLNPDGALAAMTRSYAQRPQTGQYNNGNEMVVVANVFSNGTASLADVVQAPRDRRMLEDFESALRHDPSFVKASLDRRPDTMQIVFSMGVTQSVEVDDRNY